MPAKIKLTYAEFRTNTTVVPVCKFNHHFNKLSDDNRNGDKLFQQQNKNKFFHNKHFADSKTV